MSHVHSSISSTAYIPTVHPHLALERGQFSFERFMQQDTENLPPHIVQWSFLGMIVLHPSLVLFEPGPPTALPQAPYDRDLFQTPSLLNNNWLRQVLPFTSAETRASHAEHAAIDLLDTATEASLHPTAPFPARFSGSFYHAEPVRKALRTFRFSSGLNLHHDDIRSLHTALTPWHFLWSIPLPVEGRISAAGIPSPTLATLCRNLVFFLNCMFTNDDFFPAFPPGFSPFLLRSPLAGNLLWAASTLEHPLTRDTWASIASSDPAFALSLTAGVLFHIGELIQQFLRWSTQSRVQLSCPATDDSVGYLPKCALVADTTPFGISSNKQYCINWRSTFTSIFSHPTVLSHRTTNAMAPVLKHSLPTYFSVAASADRTSDRSRRRPAENPSPPSANERPSRRQCQNPSGSTPPA